MITATIPYAEVRKASATAAAAAAAERKEQKRGKSAVKRPGFGNYSRRLLTAEEERVLAARIKRGDMEARNALIVANIRLVVHLAKHYHCSGATIDDLIQEGTRGLIRAARDYDPEIHNTRFATYATYWVRNMMQRAIAANASLIRIPDYMFRMRSAFRRALVQLGDASLPADSPMAKLSKRQCRSLAHSMIEQTPYVMIGTDGELTSLEDAIADSYQPELELEREETIQQLYEALNRLTPIESWIIRRRFGISDPAGSAETDDPASNESARPRRMTFREVSRLFGISPLHVRKLEESALQKLHDYLRPRVAPDGILDD